MKKSWQLWLEGKAITHCKTFFVSVSAKLVSNFNLYIYHKQTFVIVTTRTFKNFTLFFLVLF